MIDLSPFFAAPPFAWQRAEKSLRLVEALRQLQRHEAACPPYRRLSRLLGGGAPCESVEAFPISLCASQDAGLAQHRT